jgi:hypothetical protein
MLLDHPVESLLEGIPVRLLLLQHCKRDTASRVATRFLD